jgi:flagellar biosynthesis/type III secretory pathway protein FliH
MNGFFETYLSLTKNEEEELMEEIKQLDQQEEEKILKLPNSWREKGIAEGIQKGTAEGMQKGIAEGIQKGIQEGKMEEKRQTVLEMLKEGLTVDLIAKVTKISRSEIEELKKKL